MKRAIGGLIYGVLFTTLFIGALIGLVELTKRLPFQDWLFAFEAWAGSTPWFGPAVVIAWVTVIVGGIWGLGVSIYEELHGRKY